MKTLDAIRNVDKDVFELRTDALQVVLEIGGAVLAVSLLLVLLFHSASLLLPVLAMLGAFAVSYGFKRTGHTRLATQLLVAVLILLPVMLIRELGAQPALYYFFILPVFITSLLISGRATLWVTALSIVLMFAVTFPQLRTVATLSMIFVPALITLVVGLISALNEFNILQMIYWALDLQMKDAERAEMFYRQGEELKKALLEVNRSRLQLEKMNAELSEANRKTEWLSNAKTIFFSNMSHEMRTPLNAIIGYSSSMLSMPEMYGGANLATTHKQPVELIRDNGMFLVELLTDLLDLSKIEAGKFSLHQTALDLAGLFDNTLATVIGLTKGKPVQIKLDVSDVLPKVWADPARIRQVILNLMSNAIKFTSEGSVTLHAHVERDTVVISVIDTGVGIPESALATIFNRFEQAERTTDKKYGGTGLGLDISKQLCQLHGGDLVAESKLGVGSTFTFSLPIWQGQAGEGDEAQITDGNITVFNSQQIDEPETYSVCLVQPHTNERNAVQDALEAQGYIVISPEGGADAMDMILALQPDVIVVDTQLTDMDGWELIDSLRKANETVIIPRIICGINNSSTQQLHPEIEIFLQKPVSPEAVLSSIQQLRAVAQG